MVSIILLTLRHQRLSLIASCSTDGHAGVCDCFQCPPGVVDISAAFSKDSLFKRLHRCDAGPLLVVRKMLPSTIPMSAEARYEPSPSVADAENWLALGTGALLLIVAASGRSLVGACLAASSAPLLYGGITGRWPDVLNGHVQPDSTRTALAGACDALVLPNGADAVKGAPRGRPNPRVHQGTSIGTANRSSRWARAPNCSRRAGSIRHYRTGRRTQASSSPPTPHR
jgi:hypothetical protein